MSPSLSPSEISTQRLQLTELREEDAESLFAYRSIPEIANHLTWLPDSVEDALQWIRGTREQRFDEPGTWYQSAVRLKETGELVGDLGTHFVADNGNQVEIGYTFSPRFHGRGLATEAVGAWLDFLLGPLGKHRVYASVDPVNEASMALLRRLGLRQEGHFRKGLWFKGKWVDDVVFAVSRLEHM